MIFGERKPKDYSQRSYYMAPYFAKPGEVGDLFGYSNFEVGEELEADFAIVDLETSGLTASSCHVIEIAIVRVSPQGKVIDRFETLLSPPDGNVGRPDIHKVNASDVIGAPSFAEAAGNILAALDGCIAVAHNAKFEEMFLAAEFARVGLSLPKIPAIDTMWLAQMELDITNYKLPTVLAHYGHAIVNAHTALGDVISISKFLPRLLQAVPTQKYPVSLQALPKLPIFSKLKPR